MASPSESAENFALFRDCLSATLLQPASSSSPPTTKSKSRRRRRQHHRQEDKPDAHQHGDPDPPLPGATDPERDAEDLSDFIDYLAAEMFDCLPEEVQQLDYRLWRDSPAVQSDFSLPLTSTSPGLVSLAAALPPSVLDTLTTYGLVSDSPEPFLAPILTAYLTPLTAAPPASAATRTDACELCARDWVPLSYHHLIPRFVHDKAVKRGWHRPEDLQNVAWLCGACHRFVHQFKNHEELARDYFTVERLLEEEEVQRWVGWVARLRWKGGRARKRA